jgi:DNA repair protein RAD50
MRKELDEAIKTEQEKQAQAEQLKAEFERLKEINVQHYAEATGFQRVFETFETLKQRKAMLEDNRKHMLDGMTEMTGEFSFARGQSRIDNGLETTDDLQHMLSNFNAHVASIEAKRAKQLELREKEDAALDQLRIREKNLASTQGGLGANKRVRKTFLEYGAAV